MKIPKIAKALEFIDDDLIVGASESARRAKKPFLGKRGIAAACLCLVAAGILGGRALLSRSHGQTGADAGHGQAAAVENVGDFAVYTDRIELPEEVNAAMDMIGCLVYKGSVYTQCETYTDDFSAAEALVGESVGKAKGTLDEWSKQEEWATEFASTYSGTVSTVKGYSEDFRLCIHSDEGEPRWLVILDNFDGIGLNTGSDLFEERLHITGNIDRVTYLTHEDWNLNGPLDHDFRKLSGVTPEQFDAFIDELLRSPFEKIDYRTDDYFYDTAVQGHLFLKMKDGTRIELRLMDGGYVGLQELGWIFVRMPGDAFDAVLRACQ